MENTQQTQSPEKKTSWMKKVAKMAGKVVLVAGVGYVCYKQGKDSQFLPGTCRKVRNTVFPTKEGPQALEPEMKSEEPVASPTSESYRQQGGQQGGFYRHGHAGKFNNNN